MAEPKRDPSVIGNSHPGACQLADTVPHVKAGTPLRATPLGYVVALPDQEPEFYATAHAEGGNPVRAYKSMTIETWEHNYRPGDRLDIEHVDDYGNLYFRRDPAGPYQATGESTVHLDTTQWLLRKGIQYAAQQVRRQDQGRDAEGIRGEEGRGGLLREGELGPGFPPPRRGQEGEVAHGDANVRPVRDEAPDEHARHGDGAEVQGASGQDTAQASDW